MTDAAAEAMSEDQFVAFELASQERHEYVDGMIRAMTGASIRHNDVAGNLFVALRSAARGTGCRVNIEGVRLRVNSRRHYYPDVIVSCEGATDTHTLAAPCLVAEVLSPSTALIDRGEKRISYMAMPSLRHYLLIDLDARAIEHQWRVGAEDPWYFELGVPGGELRVTCPAAATLSVDDIFAEA